jgi:hypothetical protein
MFLRILAVLTLLAAIPHPAVAQVPVPRSPIGGPELAIPDGEHQLIVKFMDHLRARALADGSVQLGDPDERQHLRDLARRFGLRFTQLIRLPSAKLRELELRAQTLSGRAQPDLRGILVAGVLTEEDTLTVARLLRDLASVEFAYVQNMAPPPPEDIDPPTPDLSKMQTYFGGELGIDVHYAFALGAKGQAIRFADCEYNWVLSHEDLVDSGITPEPGQTPKPLFPDHGTAVLGMVSAGQNGYGVTGMAPLAPTYVYSEYTIEEGSRRVTAVTNAIADSGFGDVVLLEMQTSLFGGAYGPAEFDPAVWLVVKAGFDAGVIVVAAAGNGNVDLDGPAYAGYLSRGDSGSLIVGAGTKLGRHKASFSTYGSRVNLQGWGDWTVFTAGYGNYAKYGNDPDQTYTDDFSGTSSASPFVASACLLIQSHMEQTLGTRLAPLEMRALLINTGKPQGSGGHIGPLPDLVAAFRAQFGLVTFCTAKQNLTCGAPSIGAAGGASATAASGFTVTGGPARSCKAGMLLYNTSLGAALPFQGGTLCIAATGLRRAGSTNSMGTAGNDCDGFFAIDMNAFAQGSWTVPDCDGQPAGIPANTPAAFLTTPGTNVYGQYWGRDSMQTGSFVSDGLSWVIGP